MKRGVEVAPDTHRPDTATAHRVTLWRPSGTWRLAMSCWPDLACRAQQRAPQGRPDQPNVIAGTPVPDEVDAGSSLKMRENQKWRRLDY
jgi:hypothetical protein